jgi:hypothetical protein
LENRGGKRRKGTREVRNAYTVLLARSTRNTLLEKNSRSQQDNIKVHLKIMLKNINLLQMAQFRSRREIYENDNETCLSIQIRNLLFYFRGTISYKLLN